MTLLFLVLFLGAIACLRNGNGNWLTKPGKKNISLMKFLHGPGIDYRIPVYKINFKADQQTK